MVRTNQGGSILGFTIVGAVLVLLLIGGAYFVRHNLTPTDGSSEPVVQIDETDSENGNDEGDTGVDSEAPEVSDEDAEIGQNDSSDQQSTDDSPGRGDADESADDSLPTTGVADDDSAPGSLPQTGPSSVLVSSAMLAIVVALAVRYHRSRGLPI